MTKPILAALLSIPFAVNAEEFFVQYEGTVSSIDRARLSEAPPFAIGDPIRGTLTIDTGRAPTDDLPDDPQIGQYFGGGGFDFILGPRHPAGGRPSDSVNVYNDWEPPSPDVPREDAIIIVDGWFAPNDQFNLLLGLHRPITLGQLFSDDGLEQSLDVRGTPDRGPWGYIERGLGEFRRVVNFTLSRLSIRPGVCRP